MGFVEIRFPTDIAYGASGGPQYSTEVVMTAAGHEQRNVNWQQARARYNVAHGVKTQEQLEVLIAFFRARKGRAYGFRFKDWSDYRASRQHMGVGDGVRVEFQLLRHYVSGEVLETRSISKPVEGTVRVYVNGVVQGAGVTVHHASGRVVFESPPLEGEIIEADYEFDVPVRFDTDSLSARLEAYGAYSWGDIPLVEIRVDG